MPESTRDEGSRWLGPAALGSFAAAWAVMAWFLSRHVAVGANSDAATVMLAGWDVFHGNPLLHGWQLTADPFWTSDALVFGAVASVIGFSETVMRVEVVAVAVAVVVLSLRIATVEARHRLLAAVPVVFVICLAPQIFRSLFLLPVVHVMTAGYCLLAFLLLRRPSRARAAGTAVVLALAVMGDAIAYAIGVLPVALVAAVGLFRPSLRRLSVRRFGASAVGTALAVAVLHLARALGGFQVGPLLPTAPPSTWLYNLIGWGPRLTRSDIGSARLAVCALGVAACLGLFLVGTFRRSSPRDEWSAGVLAAGACGGVALFVFLTLPGLGEPEARYLTPTVIYAAAAASLALGRVMVSGVMARVVTTAAVVGVAFAAVQPVRFMTGPVAANPDLQVIGWLEARHLTHGIAPYWDASSLVVASGNRVQPRPVVTVHGRLQFDTYNSRLDWFRAQPRFLVYEDRYTSAHGGALNPASAVAAFGRPTETVLVAGFHVMVWPHTHRLPMWLG